MSVVIVNYNTGTYLDQCLASLSASKLTSFRIETVIVDNASTDNSFTQAKLRSHEFSLIHPTFLPSPTNLGFSQGNNLGLTKINPQSRYVLFLNPDTTVEPTSLRDLITYFDHHPEVDAATANVILVTTNFTQPESHRGFPTPRNAAIHFFLPFLPRLFPHSSFFNGYFSGHLDLSSPTPIDACVGACLMVKHQVGNAIGWWCPDYFFYGEDLDFCYQLKEHGFKLWFLPQIKIYHYQGVSSGIKNKTSKAGLATKVLTAKASTNAMRIFYRRNLYRHYPLPLRWLVGQGINLLEIFRLSKAKFSS